MRNEEYPELTRIEIEDKIIEEILETYKPHAYVGATFYFSEAFNNDLNKGDYADAYQQIKYQKQIFKKILEIFHELYQAPIQARNELIKMRGRIERSPYFLKEVRLNNLYKFLQVGYENLEHFEEKEKNVDLNNPEDLKNLEASIVILNINGYDIIQTAIEGLHKSYQILKSSPNDDVLEKEIKNFQKETLNTLIYFTATNEAYKHFGSIKAPDGEIYGTHGIYDHSEFGNRQIALALNQLILPNVLTLRLTEEGVKEWQEDMRRIGFADKEIEEFFVNGLKRTGLLELYTLNGIDRLLITPEKLELIVKERGNLLFDVLEKARCHPGIKYIVIDGFLLGKYRIPILNFYIQHGSKQLNSPTTFDEQVSRAKKLLFNSYMPVLKETGISASSLASILQRAQSGEKINYSILSESYKSVKENILKLASTEPKILKSSELRKNLDIIWDEIENYRKESKFKGRPSNYLVDLLESLNNTAIKLYEMVDYKHILSYENQTEDNLPSYLS
jgi:hypothetical protein